MIAQSEPVPDQARRFELAGRHVLGTLIGFFGVIFAVNGYFLYAALRTHTGVVAVEPYRKGLAYNNRISAAERQADLGWQDAVSATRDGLISVTISDRSGAPVSGLLITGMLGRPAADSADKVLALHESGAGRYAASAGSLVAGSWIISIEARDSSGQPEPVYRARRRLWLRP